jgi:hypothetical protein
LPSPGSSGPASTVAIPVSDPHAISSSRNALGFFGHELSPYQRAPRARERHVRGAPLLDDLLRAELGLEPRQVAVVARQDVAVAPQLEVERLPALGRVLRDHGVRQQAVRHARHEDVVELQPLRDVDRHHLHRVGVARLDRRPLLFVEPLDRVDVLQERAERQLALDRLERVHLVEERGEVAAGGLGTLAVEVGVELVEDPDPADHLAHELADRPACLHPERGELVAERRQAVASVLGQALDLVEPLERLGEQHRLGLGIVVGQLVLLLEPLRLDRRAPGHGRHVLEPDAVARAEQDPRERHRGRGIVDRSRVGEDLDDLGLLEQPREPEDLDRDPALLERASEVPEQPGRAAEHRHLGPR